MIGVVGGGIAGLAAAYRLQQRGHEVQVFEASEGLGGLAATYETAGDRIEKFYHHLSKSEETILELAAELEIDVEWRYKSDAFYVEGTVHPMDKPWEILAYPYLSFYDKFRLGMLVSEIDVRGGNPAETPTTIWRTSRTSRSRTSCSNTPLRASTSTSGNHCSTRSSVRAKRTSPPRGCSVGSSSAASATC